MQPLQPLVHFKLNTVLHTISCRNIQNHSSDRSWPCANPQQSPYLYQTCFYKTKPRHSSRMCRGQVDCHNVALVCQKHLCLWRSCCATMTTGASGDVGTLCHMMIVELLRLFLEHCSIQTNNLEHCKIKRKFRCIKIKYIHMLA